MTSVLDLIAAWPGARWLQDSGTAYLFVNAAHILGLALLLGSIVTLDLQLIARSSSLRDSSHDSSLAALAAVLSRTAAWGLALAVLTGLWLFSVRPLDYWGNAAFLCKLGLLVMALANVAWQHRGADWAKLLNGQGVATGVRVRAALSLLLWCAVLLAGRWIGFL